jgi:hypothetical protein
MGWIALEAYVAGKSHVRAGKPCQDYGRAEILSDRMVIGALSDGAGSASMSGEGARLAVDLALDRMRKGPLLEEDVAPGVLEDFFAGILVEARDLLSLRAGEIGTDPRELACTLLVLAASPRRIAAMQVGDGFIVARFQDGPAGYEILFRPDKGEYINETVFITQSSALEEMQFALHDRPPVFFCASTDGMERIALDLRDWSPHQPFFGHFEDSLSPVNDIEQGNRELREFLESEAVADRSDDDKSVLIGTSIASTCSSPARPSSR